MTIAYVADRGVRNSTGTGTATVTLTNPTLIKVGNYLIARVAVDNSGASGARPGLAVTDSRSHTWTAPSGALQDPGVASAGTACYLAYVKVVTAFQAGDTVVFTWTTGTPVSAIVIEEWSGIRSVTPEDVAQVTANNVSTTAQPAISINPTGAGHLVYVACAAEQLGSEWGAQDSDTTNGTWVAVTKDAANTGTHDTSQAIYGGYKIVTASGSQTWNNTLGATGDWAACALVFADEVDVPEFAHRRRFLLVGEDEPYFYRPKPKSAAVLFVTTQASSGAVTAGVALVAQAAGGKPGDDILPAELRVIQGDPPEYVRLPRAVNPALYDVAAAAAGAARAVVAVVATAAGKQSQSGVGVARAVGAVVATAVESRQASGAVSARVAVVARAVGSRQTSGAVTASSTVIARPAGAQGAVIGGSVSARVAVVATAVETRQATGASSARVAVVATPAEKKQATGGTVAASSVVAKPAGAQGSVIGGKVTATCTVVVRTAGARAATGASTAQVSIVSTPAEKRQTSGAARAVGAVVTKAAGVQGAVIGGKVTATVAVIVLASEKRAVTAAAASARFAVIATAVEKRGATGAARAVGAVYSMSAHMVAGTGGWSSGAADSQFAGVAVRTQHASEVVQGQTGEGTASHP